jgi:hypothetical protein
MTKPNIDELDLDTLGELAQEIEVRIETLRSEAATKILDDLLNAAARAGLTVDQIVGKVSAGRRRRKSNAHETSVTE